MFRHRAHRVYCSELLRVRPRESHLWDWCQETLCQNIVLQDSILSELSNYIIHPMSWQWSLYSYKPRLDWFADSVLQLHCNELIKTIYIYFNASESENDCSNCVDTGQSRDVSSCPESSVSALGLSAVPGLCQWPDPRPAPLGDVILVIILIERHSTSVNTSVMLQPRSGYSVLFVSEGPRYSGICHDASGSICNP